MVWPLAVLMTAPPEDVAFLRRNIIQQDLEVGRRPCSPGHELGPAEMVQLLTNAGFPDVRWPTLPPRAPARAVPS